MNSSRKICDIRPTSSDDRYAGVVFSNKNTGKIDEAIRQAKDAPDFGPVIMKGRAELERFLNVSDRARASLYPEQAQSVDRQLTIQDRDSLIPDDVQ